MGILVKRFAFSVPIILFNLLFLGAKTYAYETIAISPTTFTPSISPGQSFSGDFKVNNQGSSAFNAIIYSNPYSVSGEEYTPDFTIIPGSPNPTKWITFSKPSSFLTPRQIDDIHFTIKVPPNTPAGGYYAVAFAETRNPAASTTTGVTINQRVGAIFYITVPGNIIQGGNLETWSTKFLQYPPLTSYIRVKDSGALHFKASYNYYVDDIFGERKLRIIGEKYLLPHTIRRISLTWPKTPSFGLFKVYGNVSVLGKDYKLGTKYVLVMSKAARVYTLIITVIIFILILFFIIFKLLRRDRKYRRR